MRSHIATNGRKTTGRHPNVANEVFNPSFHVIQVSGLINNRKLKVQSHGYKCKGRFKVKILSLMENIPLCLQDIHSNPLCVRQTQPLIVI